MEGSIKFKGPAENEKVAFSEESMTLSDEAQEKIDKLEGWEEDPDDVLGDDDEGTYAVLPEDRPVKSEKTNDDKDSDKSQDSDSEPPKEQLNEDEKGEKGEKPEIISTEEFSKLYDPKTGEFDFEKFELLVNDPSDPGKTAPLNKIMDEYVTVLADHENDANWKKSNTDKSQKLANDQKELIDDRTVFDQKVSDYDAVIAEANVEDAINAIKGKEFLESTDEYFDGKENNPIRKIVDAVTGLSAKQKKATADADVDEAKANAEVIEAFNADYKAIQDGDEAYKDTEKMDELVKFAEDNVVKLPIAKKMVEHGTLTKENKTLSDDIKKLTKELKERNEQVKTMKKNLGTVEGKPDKSAPGPNGEEKESKTASSFEEATARIRKKLNMT